ncbi:unnamed protein product, partial [Didymodactylos carnosus]
IPVNIANILGVRLLQQKVIEDLSIGIPFGQHEKLTTRIQHLLESYPQDKDILKELLQNAD